MELNPNDNQGIRYLLANCLYEARCDSELEKLLSDYSGDTSAFLSYTKALYLFRKFGASKRATKALIEAFQANKYVPIFLSDIVEMPDESPSTIGFGDDRASDSIRNGQRIFVGRYRRRRRMDGANTGARNAEGFRRPRACRRSSQSPHETMGRLAIKGRAGDR